MYQVRVYTSSKRRIENRKVTRILTNDHMEEKNIKTVHPVLEIITEQVTD